jgi:hypothetical protein
MVIVDNRHATVVVTVGPGGTRQINMTGWGSDIFLVIHGAKKSFQKHINSLLALKSNSCNARQVNYWALSYAASSADGTKEPRIPGKR